MNIPDEIKQKIAEQLASKAWIKSASQEKNMPGKKISDFKSPPSQYIQ